MLKQIKRDFTHWSQYEGIVERVMEIEHEELVDIPVAEALNELASVARKTESVLNTCLHDNADTLDNPIRAKVIEKYIGRLKEASMYGESVARRYRNAERHLRETGG